MGKAAARDWEFCCSMSVAVAHREGCGGSISGAGSLLGLMSTRVPCLTHPPNVRLTIPSYPTPTIMKHILFLMFAFTTFLAVSCNKQKQAIDSQTEASKAAIDHQKEAVDTHAKQAKEQVDINAKIDKANIEAKQAAEQAQLDAEKKKAEADAAAAKAKVDAEKK